MTTLLNNLKANPGNSWSTAETFTRHAQQFRLLLPATITELTFMLAKNNTELTGTISAKIYASDGVFRDPQSVPTGGALATSTNTADASGLADLNNGGAFQEIDFTFNSVELPAGTYWASVECDDIYTNSENSQLYIAEDGTNDFVYIGNNLGSFSEYYFDGYSWSWLSARDIYDMY